MWAMIEKFRRRDCGIGLDNGHVLHTTYRAVSAICHTRGMEDIVAVELSTTEGTVCYFVTWGRIQNRVDPEPLERLILKVADHFAIPGTPASARLCESLQDAREAPFFYEAIFDFAQKTIPFGSGYEKWRRRMDKRMRRGQEMYCAGPIDEDKPE